MGRGVRSGPSAISAQLVFGGHRQCPDEVAEEDSSHEQAMTLRIASYSRRPGRVLGSNPTLLYDRFRIAA